MRQYADDPAAQANNTVARLAKVLQVRIEDLLAD